MNLKQLLQIYALALSLIVGTLLLLVAIANAINSHSDIGIVFVVSVLCAIASGVVYFVPKILKGENND